MGVFASVVWAGTAQEIEGIISEYSQNMNPFLFANVPPHNLALSIDELRRKIKFSAQETPVGPCAIIKGAFAQKETPVTCATIVEEAEKIEMSRISDDDEGAIVVNALNFSACSNQKEVPSKIPVEKNEELSKAMELMQLQMKEEKEKLRIFVVT